MLPVRGAGLSLSANHQEQDEEKLTKAWRAAMERFQVWASTQSSSHFTFLNLSGQYLQNQVKLEKKEKEKKH